MLEREDDIIDEQRYYDFTHFSDNLMTDAEILEMPRVWIVGGDGGMGDIGYQNVSKMVLQNRPNVKAVMLDTQVYSNTGDSTPILAASSGSPVARDRRRGTAFLASGQRCSEVLTRLQCPNARGTVGWCVASVPARRGSP